MAYRTNSVLPQIVVQRITLATTYQNREKVVGVLLIGQQIRQCHQRIIQMFIFFSLEVSAAIHYTAHSLVNLSSMQSRYVFQR